METITAYKVDGKIFESKEDAEKEEKRLECLKRLGDLVDDRISYTSNKNLVMSFITENVVELIDILVDL